jgi:hypothetical protein
VSVNENGMMPERRKTQRNRTILSATVRELNKTSTWSCTVRNISDGGARIEIANSGWFQNNFNLEIVSRDMRMPVRVVWRRLDAVGVAFRSENDLVSRQLGDRVASLAEERDRLRRRVSELTS